MRKSKFDEFVNFYDGETKGQYAYYYRSLWDACAYADKTYLGHHKDSVWDTKEYGSWLKYFEGYVKEHQEDESFKKSVCNKIEEWMEAI